MTLKTLEDVINVFNFLIQDEKEEISYD